MPMHSTVMEIFQNKVSAFHWHFRKTINASRLHPLESLLSLTSPELQTPHRHHLTPSLPAFTIKARNFHTEFVPSSAQGSVLLQRNTTCLQTEKTQPVSKRSSCIKLFVQLFHFIHYSHTHTHTHIVQSQQFTFLSSFMELESHSGHETDRFTFNKRDLQMVADWSDPDHKPAHTGAELWTALTESCEERKLTVHVERCQRYRTGKVLVV